MQNFEWEEPVAISGTVKAKTEMAILLVIEEEDTEVWLPISRIDTYDKLEVGNYVDIEIPYWLARDKGVDP